MLGGTVFVDRERKSLALESTNRIGRLLKDGLNILLFPEGTSTDGAKLLPFQALFFASAIQAQTAVLPVTISYLKINGEDISAANKDQVYWYGQVPFYRHLWNILGVREMEVRVFVNSKISCAGYQNNTLTRHRLAEDAHFAILKAKGDFS